MKTRGRSVARTRPRAAASRSPTVRPRAASPRSGRRCWSKASSGAVLTAPSFSAIWAASGGCGGERSAAVGVSLNAVNRGWRAVAIGDCCLLHVRALPSQLELVSAFPLSHSEEFGSSPFLVGSVKKTDDDPLPHVRVSEGVLGADDTLFFASDALSAWLLRRAEKGEPAWDAISPLGMNTQEDRS